MTTYRKLVKIINVKYRKLAINKKTRLGATYKERDIRTEEGTITS